MPSIIRAARSTVTCARGDWAASGALHRARASDSTEAAREASRLRTAATIIVMPMLLRVWSLKAPPVESEREGYAV